ncbi:hypothetical protein KUTeg_021457 [Tegillarca granosa]|uniref:FLYWCH-type domain-containing protein n=1 Tax=Tegillarca granosa TaxID=220873 RepID=A0ABQ9E9F7_TEGGR|nr:hypothetical protein KUTeg_021457 [Tegillarca granosa]
MSKLTLSEHNSKPLANVQLNIQFVENRLGNENLSQRGERCYWRCVQSACPARINTLNIIPVNIEEQHNHPSDSMQLNVDKVINKMKDRKRLTTSLYNQRSKTIPKLPATRQDINLEGKWRETPTGDNFLLIYDGDQQRILIFSTDFNLTHLTTASTVYGDGTFYSCPQPFTSCILCTPLFMELCTHESSHYYQARTRLPIHGMQVCFYYCLTLFLECPHNITEDDIEILKEITTELQEPLDMNEAQNGILKKRRFHEVSDEKIEEFQQMTQSK